MSKDNQNIHIPENATFDLPPKPNTRLQIGNMEISFYREKKFTRLQKRMFKFLLGVEITELEGSQ